MFKTEVEDLKDKKRKAIKVKMGMGKIGEEKWAKASRVLKVYLILRKQVVQEGGKCRIWQIEARIKIEIVNWRKKRIEMVWMVTKQLRISFQYNQTIVKNRQNYVSSYFKESNFTETWAEAPTPSSAAQ